jgi:glycerol kinase
MTQDSGVQLKELRVDGGMTANSLLMQFQADILGTEVVRPQISETTALGAAYGAGLAVGFWESTDAVRELWVEDQRWSPSMDATLRRDLLGRWHAALERSLDWV